MFRLSLLSHELSRTCQPLSLEVPEHHVLISATRTCQTSADVSGDCVRWTERVIGVSTSCGSSCVAGECLAAELLILRLSETAIEGS